MGTQSRKVRLCFIWHMHQPDYLDPESGEVALPWVGLHACKGYFDMVHHLLSFPKMKATFNFSGTLLRQLQTTCAASVPSKYDRLTLSSPRDLSYDDRIYILKHFFSLAPRLIHESARMRELFGKRGRHVSEETAAQTARQFSDQDFLDLQVLFNLLWFGHAALHEDEGLRNLRKKGAGYTQEEKEYVATAKAKLIGKVLDGYRKLHDSGRIEISFTPFYHPILPLLIDSESASAGLPGVTLPPRFVALEDACWQVEAGADECHTVFGKRPAGMWPAEGGVSEATIKLVADMSIRWTATDEGILWKSIRISSWPGSFSRESMLYRPYKLHGEGPAILFRDHYLSDRVGFTYQSMDPSAAVEDFVGYLRKAASRGSADPPVVSVILDGENPWPYYPEEGALFLRALYSRLSAEDWIETTTPSTLLDSGVECSNLPYLFPGSWIDSSFGTWIGDHAKNRAWKLLGEARSAVLKASCSEEARHVAMEHIRTAEGSDWFWWYGEPNTSTEDPIFDHLFRARLRSALLVVGAQVPLALLAPPRTGGRPASLVRGPLTFIHPGIDGTGERYFEWYNAGKYEVEQVSAEMESATPFFSAVYYGFDYDFLYLRLDPCATPAEPIEIRLQKVEVRFILDEEAGKYLDVSFPSPLAVKLSGVAGGEGGEKAALRRILEVAIPFATLGVKRGTKLRISVLVMREGTLLERYPTTGYFEITVPDAHWDKSRWIV